MSDPAYSIQYGATPLQFTLPASCHVDTLDTADSPPLTDLSSTFLEALASPIGLTTHALNSFAPTDTVSIVVSDSFRQTRIDQLLPTLINELNDRSIPSSQISFTFSTGTHRGPTESETKAILGEKIAHAFQDRTFAHDPDDTRNLVSIGTTSRGTRVEVNKRVHESDRIILTGSVVLHYFGGFGGGRKSMVPGLASRNTIAQNHAMNLHPKEDILDPNVRIGHTIRNPVAEDMLEATQFTHVDFIVNTILNRDNQIAQLYVGDLVAAHEAACTQAYTTFAQPFTEQAGLVIAASPTTKNFVQTHKALFNAYQAVKPQGRIILLAPCPEGVGGEQFKKWLRLGDRATIIAGLRKQSEINGQTALSTREKAPITTLITEMSDDEVALIGAKKSPSLEQAISAALKDLHASGISNPRCRIMPSAAYTVPVQSA